MFSCVNSNKLRSCEMTTRWIHIESKNVAGPFGALCKRCDERPEFSTHAGDENATTLHGINFGR